MLEFKTPTPKDRQWVMDLSARSNLRSADFSYGTIFCWSDPIGLKVARFNDRLLTRFTINGETMYTYPVGSGELKPAVEAIKADAEMLGAKFKMKSITRDVLEEVENLFQQKPKLWFSEDFSDYVYKAESLANLSGRKMHQKKNHVNRFMSENKWSFEPIDSGNIDECHEMAANWFVDAEEERDNSGYLGEIRAIRKTLDNYFGIGFDGGLIRVNGEISAFTIGEMISKDTMVTHYEKASPHVNGAYTIINQQFAKYMMEKYPELVYINREEDMGLEGLRQAKRSYHPEFMVDKFTAVWE
jgi:hypothetical protein